MEVLCTIGLFIGVDRYSYLPPNMELGGAGADASNLQRFFLSRLNGTWSLFEEDGLHHANRGAILKVLRDFIDSVPSGEAGLVFFAGHGFETEQGLSLGCSDIQQRLEVETGILLQDVLNSFRECNEVHFLIALDCCRPQRARRLASIPENVTVLWPKFGGPTYENSHGGALATNLMQAIDSIGTEQSGGQKLATFDAIASVAIRSVSTQLQTGNSLGYHVTGSRSRDVYFELDWEAFQTSERKTSQLEAQLISNLPLHKRSSIFKQIRTDYLRYFGWPNFDNPSSDKPILQLEGGRVAMNFPRESSNIDGVAFVKWMVRRFPNVFDELKIDVSFKVPFEKVRQMRHSLSDAIYLNESDSDTSKLLWRGKTNLQGVITVSQSGPHTEFSIRCYSPEGRALPLAHLRGGVCTSYSLIRSIGDCYE